MENTSILDGVKKSLGILDDYDYFDHDIITAINSAFLVLNQLGVGPSTPYRIENSFNTWDEFLEDGRIDLVRSYIPLRVKLLFDPPGNSFLVDCINKQIQEFEFRMLVEAEKNLLPEPDMSGIYKEVVP